MAFTKVNPGGWAVNAKLAAAQINTLDTDHANALDKTTAGDSLAGAITVASTGSIALGASAGLSSIATSAVQLILGASSAINANSVGTIAANATAAIYSGIAGGIRSVTTGGIDTNIAGGITTGVAGGITGGVAGGITAGVAGGITGGVAGGITGGVAGGIQSGVDGGIKLTGTAADVITFGTPHTRTVVRPIPAVLAYATSWTYGGLSSAIPQNCLLGGATNSTQYMIIPSLHDGATINWVEVRFYSTVHTPAALPVMAVYRIDTTVGAGSASLILSSVGPTTYAGPLTVASQSIRFTCNQNNVIDLSKHVYSLYLVDENGAGAVAGNQYVAIAVNFTNITDMRFP